MLENCKLVEDEIIVIPAGSTLLETETQVKLYIQPEDNYTVSASNFSISGYNEIVVSHVELNDTGTPGSLGNAVEVVITFNNEPNNPYNSVDFLQNIANWADGNLPQQVLDAYDNYYGGDDSTEGNVFYIPVDIDGKAVPFNIFPHWQIVILDEIEGVKNLTQPIFGYSGDDHTAMVPAPVKLEREEVDFKLIKHFDVDSFSFGIKELQDKATIFSRGDNSWQSGKVYTVATYKLSFEKCENDSLFNQYFYGYNTDTIKLITVKPAGINVKHPYNFFVELKNPKTSRRTDSSGNVVEFIYAIDLDIKFHINVEDVIGTPFENAWIEDSQFSCLLEVPVDRWRVGEEIDYISPADDPDNATYIISNISTTLAKYPTANAKYIIPPEGISVADRDAIITIHGDPGARFKVTFQQSSVNIIEEYEDAPAGERSAGTTEFVELQGGGIPEIPEGEVTIPASGKYKFLLPDINPRPRDESNADASKRNAWIVGYTVYDMVITCIGKTTMAPRIADTIYSEVKSPGKIGSTLLYPFQQYSPVHLELAATRPSVSWGYLSGNPSTFNKPGKKDVVANGIAFSSVDIDSQRLDFEIVLEKSASTFSVSTIYAEEIKTAASNNWYKIPQTEVPSVVQPTYIISNVKGEDGVIEKEGNLDIVSVSSLRAKVGGPSDTLVTKATLTGTVVFQKFGKQSQKYTIDLGKIFNNS